MNKALVPSTYQKEPVQHVLKGMFRWPNHVVACSRLWRSRLSRMFNGKGGPEQ